MSMSLHICQCCGGIALGFDSETETDAARLNHKNKNKNMRFVDDFGACNICGEFVCQKCIRDHEGKVMEWCIACELKEVGLTVDNPDPRLRVARCFL